MNENLEKNLRHKIEVGQTMRGFMNHPGFKIWNEDLQNKINDVRNEWLTSNDPAQAEKIRTRAIQLNEALDFIKRRVIEGDNAAKMLANAQAEEGTL